MRISGFEAMTFDCYGTLIDWETGIRESLDAWIARHGTSAPTEDLLALFAEAEARLEAERPTELYRNILNAVHEDIAARLGLPVDPEQSEAFARSIGDWPPFPDTRPALSRLKERYRLVVVSNVDRESFARTQETLGVRFDGVVTAQDVGAYKPDLRMFERAFEVLAAMGIERPRILHVAQSLFHDHVPAKRLGLKTVWVNRRKGLPGWGAVRRPDADVTPDIEVASLTDLVALDDEQRRPRVAVH